jgi:PST family polysaccharide transporter
MLFWIGANIAFPMTIMLLISAPDLLLLLYGEQWLPAAPILYILAILAVIRPVWDNATILLTAIGQAKYTIVAAAIQTTTLLILGWPLTVLMAAPGTALATGVSFFAGIAVMYRVMAQKIDLNLIRIFSAPFLAAVATLGTYIILSQIIDIDNILLWIRVLGKSLYSLITFFIFLFLVQPDTTRKRFIYLRQILMQSSQKN